MLVMETVAEAYLEGNHSTKFVKQPLPFFFRAIPRSLEQNGG